LLSTQPIRRQIVAITASLIVPFGVVVAWSAHRSRVERETELQEQAGTVAATAAAYLNEYLSGIDSMASTLARHPAVMSQDREQCDELFHGVLSEQPLLFNIATSDASGALKGTGVKTPRNIETVLGLRYIKEVVATGRPMVSELMTGELSGKPTVVLWYPVFDPMHQVIGTIGFGLNLARLQSVFESIPLPEGSVITVTDSGSRVLARSLDPERFIGTVVEGSPLPPREVARSLVRTGIDGIPRFFGNATIDHGPWLLSVGIPTRIAAERLAPLWQRELTIFGASIAAVLLLSLSFSHELSRTLNALRLAAQRIAGGDLSPLQKMPVASLELSELQDAFITMSGNLREAHAALDRQVEQERRMRETLQSLQRQVVRQERLAAVGVLVSGVAHELNNPLQAILGTAELLERDYQLSEAALEELSFIKTQSGRAREIIRNLSRFSSQQSGPPALIDLRDVVAEVVQLRGRDLRNAAISLDVEATSARKVCANFTELEQVILNFIINAEQAIEAAGHQQGRILIRLSDSGKKVRLEVQDDGPGVSAEDEPKLFQPFFTTKAVGEGTGLGLSVSYGIVESYGGAIGYKSNPRGGATFFFELPVADAAATPTPVNHDRTPVLHGPLSTKV
jgi:signal transduction histidine kinase